MFKGHHRSKAAWESIRNKTQQAQQLVVGRLLRRRGHHHHHHGPAVQSMSAVAPATDDSDAPTTPTAPDHVTLSHAEKLLPNGDFYTGQWYRHLPHGIGKYLWTDGCMYEGEWRQGKTMGRGKFSWPSGATYEGDFKAGFMDGMGTYIGPNGDTYKGSWSMNLKHGSGKKSYANGDCYDGEWRSGMQDGHGRYIWKKGNEYNGQWRSGVIHGRGSLIWANGNRYDGGWEEGLPMGNGSFRWGDGSLYIGIWTNGGEEEQKGIYYPSPAATSPTARDPQAIFDRELPECKICPGETVTILPSQKRLNWSGLEMDLGGAAPTLEMTKRAGKGPDAPRPRRRGSVELAAGLTRRPRSHTVIGTNNGGSNGEKAGGLDRMCIWESDGDITCDIADGGSVMSGRSSTDSLDEPRLSRSSQQPPIRIPRGIKKQGETISKGHKNYDLMLNLQLGIRYNYHLST